MTLRQIVSNESRLIMTAGKGGVGKTTCAAAIAVRLADAGQKVLIISSDPTPSLSDIFQTEIGPVETPLAELGNLTALEIDSDLILARWKRKFGPEMYEVISSFLPFDEDIVDYVATAPGIEEEYMLDYIVERVESGGYDKVVWDTAPAGHTLKLLDMPNMFISHLTQAMRIYMGFTDYVKKVQDVTRRKPSRRRIKDIISAWEALALKVTSFIRDPKNTMFVLVTIPEALGVRQSARIIETMDGYGLPVKNLIVNNVVGPSDNEFLATRRGMQQRYLGQLRDSYSARMDIVEIPLAPNEITGLGRLRQIGDIIFA